MKKAIVLINIMFLSVYVFSQINTNEVPISIEENLNAKDIPVITMPIPNYRLINEEDSIDALNNLPPRFGFGFDVDINMENSGRWIELQNKKGRLWQLEIDCPGALSINLVYDKFNIPDGGKFFIYSLDKKKKLGAFTRRNNKGNYSNPGAFSTGLISDEKIILEYYDPYESNGTPIISIDKVVHGYKYIQKSGYLGSSGSCNVNINCPAGNNWQDEKHSVVLILIGGARIGTGSIINNTSLDGSLYLLTASHNLTGLDAISNPSAATWSFLWDYESPSCTNGTDFTPPSTSGATVVANNSVSESDFALLRLDETPFNLSPPVCVYYNGWDKTSSVPSNTACIHHPQGDVKKISLDYDQSSSSGNFWRVNDWDIGTTESGSSGAPLFNSNGKVVGQLKGGQAACGNNLYDDFGKLSVSWNFSTDPRRRLKDWLDPLGTNANTLDGAYLFFNSNTYISGPSIVCPSGNTFTINNPPSYNSIIWSCGPNLTISSGQNTPSCTFSATGSSSSWVNATLVSSCWGNVILTRKDILWTGIPTTPTNIVGFYEGQVFGLGSQPNFSISTNSLQNITNIEWVVTGGTIIYGQGTNTITVVTNSTEGVFKVKVRLTNSCGTTAYFGRNGTLSEEGGGNLMISPNPATSETTIEIVPADGQALAADASWDLEIYDSMQALKTKDLKLKGNKRTINTTGWREGVYLVRVKFGDEILSGKLMVKP